MQLVRPASEHLASYGAALARGWSPDELKAEESRAELERIHADPVVFQAIQDDPDARRDSITLPDGPVAQRLPTCACTARVVVRPPTTLGLRMWVEPVLIHSDDDAVASFAVTGRLEVVHERVQVRR